MTLGHLERYLLGVGVYRRAVRRNVQRNRSRAVLCRVQLRELQLNVAGLSVQVDLQPRRGLARGAVYREAANLRQVEACPQRALRVVPPYRLVQKRHAAEDVVARLLHLERRLDAVGGQLSVIGKVKRDAGRALLLRLVLVHAELYRIALYRGVQPVRTVAGLRVCQLALDAGQVARQLQRVCLLVPSYHTILIFNAIKDIVVLLSHKETGLYSLILGRAAATIERDFGCTVSNGRQFRYFEHNLFAFYLRL